MAVTPLSAALLLSASEGGSRSLTDVDFTLFFATLVLFVLFALVLGKFGWKPLLALIEEREKSVRDALEGSRQANTEAQALLAQHKELVRQAGQERDEILKRSLKEAEQIKADLTAKARTESDLMIARAKEQIEREKSLAIHDIREQVADLAVEAASKIVTSSLTPEAQRKLVTDFISDLPKA